MFFSVSIILFKETQFPIKFYKITLQGKNKKIDKCIILYDKDNKLTIKKYNKISFINKDDIKEMEEVKNN